MDSDHGDESEYIEPVDSYLEPCIDNTSEVVEQQSQSAHNICADLEGDCGSGNLSVSVEADSGSLNANEPDDILDLFD